MASLPTLNKAVANFLQKIKCYYVKQPLVADDFRCKKIELNKEPHLRARIPLCAKVIKTRNAIISHINLINGKQEKSHKLTALAKPHIRRAHLLCSRIPTHIPAFILFTFFRNSFVPFHSHCISLRCISPLIPFHFIRRSFPFRSFHAAILLNKPKAFALI